ncbi:multicopper oxidase domain-containing protein [Actinotalea sp. AC32]|nr:multicopper oxidase domain-containing protein [Actinotalea sp. AC32]
MRARWHVRVNALVLLWLVAAAAVAVGHRWVPSAGWLMVHLLLLGAVSTAILVWSAHFAEAVRRRPLRGGRPHQAARLALHTAGALTVVTGLLTGLEAVVVGGAVAVAAAAVWHAAVLTELGRSSLGVRLGWTTWFFVAAALAMPVGATLGVVLAREPAGDLASRAYVAHVSVMLLGWVGLTVLGTVVTLWPTMLRVPVEAGALPAARRGLQLLVPGLAVAVVAALVGPRALVAAGLAVYLAGLAVTVRPLAAGTRRRPPEGFAPWSVGLGLAWFAGAVALWAGAVATAPTWAVAQARFASVLPALAVGFAAQVLVGALAHLGPMALGGGPAAVRAARAVVERAAGARLVLVNGGLALFVLPTPSLVRVGTSMVVLGALVADVLLVVRAAVVSYRARRSSADAGGPVPGAQAVTAAELLVPRARRSHGPALAGGVALVLVVAGGVAGDPAAVGLGTSAVGAARPTGRVVEVDVVAGDMRFEPASVTVDAGDAVVLRVTNADAAVHDLVLDTGAASGRLASGGTARIDLGVVGRDVEGWCSVAGHRQMGMTFTVDVRGDDVAAGTTTGTTTDATLGADGEHGAGAGAAAAPVVDVMAPPGDRAVVRDPVLPPAPPTTVHRRRIVVSEVEQEVAPGVTRTVWTFDGTAPGPVLRGRVGDTFEITLVNDGTVGHSIDFHAGSLAPDRPMRTIGPGEELTYTFTATRAGIWMYHCSTMPMSLHIAQGMAGAVIVDPPDLPPVDREFVLVQHELYLGGPGLATDEAALRSERPAAVVFDGHASQYRHAPLEARVGERVRFWVLDAGPNRPSAFHVVGGQFDTVWSEGAYLLGGPGTASTAGGAQVLALQPAQGGFVELVLPEAGTYPFVSHVMVDAERGAAGVLRVVP